MTIMTITNDVKQEITKEESEIVEKKIEPSSRLSSRKLVARVAKQEFLPKIKGIGPVTIEKLKNAGISSIDQLEKVTLDELKNHGFGLKLAQKIVDAIKNHMKEVVGQKYLLQNGETLQKDPPFQTRTINTKQNVEDGYNITQEEQDGKYKLETVEEFDENTDINEQTLEDDEDYVNEEELEKKIDVEDKIDINDSLVSNFLRNKLFDGEKLHNFEREKEEAPETEQLNETEQLSVTILKALVKEIEIDLKKADFYIVPKNNSFEPFYKNLTLIAVKSNPVKELLNIIHVLPIKICTLKGCIVVSEEEVTYHPINNDFYDPFMIRADLDGFLTGQESIYKDFETGDVFIQFLKTYLKKEIEIEKTFMNKRLLFRQGPLQYKTVVDPVFVCQNEVGFLEKRISFPYQRNSNFHIVNIDKFASLLEFLEKKYLYVETCSEQDNSIKKNSDCVNQFLKQCRIASMPFVAFGFLFLAISIFLPSLIKTFISLSIALLALFSITCFLASFKFRKKRKVLKEEFVSPYYNLIEMNETDAVSVAEELTEQEAKQFFYECFGKDEKYLILLANRSKIEDNDLNLNKKEMISNTPKVQDVEQDSFFEKYRSFLED